VRRSATGFLLLVALVHSGERARAADAPAPPAAPALKALTDAEAEPLLDGLKKAWKARKADEALPAIEAVSGVAHPEVEPLLGKLLSHPVTAVAARAARALGDRPSPKVAGTLWRAWVLPLNDRRWEVKTAMLESLARLRAPLDAKQYDEVEKVWKQAPSVEAMNAVSGYFAAVATDKRPCKLLATWLDEPRAGSVHDAANPPAAWWEARWKLWQATKGGAAAALQAITGQSFETSAQAKAWFDANPKFGVKW
jgi:hypothetical protein